MENKTRENREPAENVTGGKQEEYLLQGWFCWDQLKRVTADTCRRCKKKDSCSTYAKHK